MIKYIKPRFCWFLAIASLFVLIISCQKFDNTLWVDVEDNSLQAKARQWYTEERSKNNKNADLDLSKLSIDWSKGSIGYNAYGDSVLFVPMHSNKIDNVFYYELNFVRNGEDEMLGAIKEYHGDPFGTEELFLHFYSGSGTLLQVALHNPLEGTMRRVSDILRDRVATSIGDKIAQNRSNSNGYIVIEEITVTGYQDPQFYYDKPSQHELEIPSGAGDAGRGAGGGQQPKGLNINKLSEKDKKALKEAIEDAKQRNCAYKKLLENMEKNGNISFMVDGNRKIGGGGGMYYANAKEIVYMADFAVGNVSLLTHEVFHAFQHQSVYGASFGNYSMGKAGYINVEFK